MTTPDIGNGLIILDRDGVINADSRDFVKSPDEWTPLPGSIEAIAGLSRSGYTVAVASNQSGLARGMFDRAALAAMHDKLLALVAAAGGALGEIVICPHGPDDDCDCRKPKPGLLEQLAAHYGITLEGVPVIGDSLRDLQAAATAGAVPMLVLTGNGRRTLESLPASLAGVAVYRNLAEAAADIVDTNLGASV